jgi:battenin
MVFLLLQAYFNFIPYIYIIFPIIFWEGLLGGATYVNSMVLIYSNIDASHREFSLGVVSVADDIGISLSAVTSIFLERFLRRHNHID